MDIAALKKEARRKKTSAQRLLEIAAMDMKMARFIAGGENTPPDVLDTLANLNDVPVQRRIAGNPKAWPATLERLAQRERKEIQRALATNPSISPVHMTRLARHKDIGVRLGLAWNPNLTETVALELLHGPVPWVRHYVAQYMRYKTWNTRRVYQVMAQHEDSLVRCRAAEACTEADILEQLCRDPERWIRHNALGNPNLPLAVLLEHLPDEFENLDGGTAFQILRRADLTTEWLERFAQHPSPYIRGELALNPNTPEHVILQLAHDKDVHVLHDVAKACTLPEELYWQYARHSNANLRYRLTENQFLPTEILGFLQEDADQRVADAAHQRLSSLEPPQGRLTSQPPLG